MAAQLWRESPVGASTGVPNRSFPTHPHQESSNDETVERPLDDLRDLGVVSGDHRLGSPRWRIDERTNGQLRHANGWLSEQARLRERYVGGRRRRDARDPAGRGLRVRVPVNDLVHEPHKARGGVMKRWIAVLAVAMVTLTAAPAIASAANVYDGYTRVGSVTPSYGGRYTIRQVYSTAGYAATSHGGAGRSTKATRGLATCRAPTVDAGTSTRATARSAM